MLSRLSVSGVGLFTQNSAWDLGSITCVVGENATGKSTITQLIEAVFVGELTPNPAIERWTESGPLELVADITRPGIESGGLTLRRIFRQNRRKILTETWVNGSSFSGPVENASGHQVLRFGEQDLTNEDVFVSRLYERLTAGARASKRERLSAIGKLVERHSERLTTAMGRLVVVNGKILLETGQKQASVWHQGSLGMRMFALTQLVAVVAYEMSIAAPTLLVLDDTFGGMDIRLAGELSEQLWRMVGPTLQLIITTHDAGLSSYLRADTTISLVHPRTGLVGLKVVSSQRPQHGITVLQEEIKKYGPGSEDRFIDEVLVPSLVSMGWQGVRRVSSHGPSEKGIDLGPFSKPGPLGRRVMVGLQAKAGDLHAKSGKGGQSVETLVDEIRKALDFRYVDRDTNYLRRLDYVIAAISGRLSDPARDRFYSAFEGDHRVILWEAPDLAELLWQHQMRVPFFRH